MIERERQKTRDFSIHKKYFRSFSQQTCHENSISQTSLSSWENLKPEHSSSPQLKDDLQDDLHHSALSSWLNRQDEKIRKANQQSFSKQSHPTPPHPLNNCRSQFHDVTDGFGSEIRVEISNRCKRCQVFNVSQSEIAMFCLPVRDPSFSTEVDTSQTSQAHGAGQQHGVRLSQPIWTVKCEKPIHQRARISLLVIPEVRCLDEQLGRGEPFDKRSVTPGVSDSNLKIQRYQNQKIHS